MPDGLSPLALRDLALGLVSCGAIVLLGVMIHRWRKGAWSLEDEDIPQVTPAQILAACMAGGLTAFGLVLFVWSYFSHGVG